MRRLGFTTYLSAATCAAGSLCGREEARAPVVLSSPRRLVSQAQRLRRPPPPPPGAKHRLPPPPPLGRGALKPASAATASTEGTPSPAGSSPPVPGRTPVSVGLPWRSPHEVLSAFIEYVPAFYVPIPTVAAILPEDLRGHFLGRGKLVNFLRRYPFFFDLRTLDGGARVDVRLRDDVSHPQKGIADEKFMMVDVGEIANYVAKPEYIVSTDSIEQVSQSVNVVQPTAPPAVRVRLEERVPVLERLCALIPAEFTPMEALEEELPEDILFHPYFDCQGGLPSIASKFPQHFQVVDGNVRLRPPHLAPLALHDYTLADSPLPTVAALVKRDVCSDAIPHWVSLTSLYEQLSKEDKRAVKKGFKSFAGFLRAHGRSLAVSQDMLQVSMWIAPTKQPERSSEPSESASPSSATATAAHAGPVAPAGAPSAETLATSPGPPAASIPPATAPQRPRGTPSDGVKFIYTQTQVINELFDRFPPNRTLNLTEAIALLPRDMAALSLPKRVLGWLAAHPQYFVVEDAKETDPTKARIRRSSERQPLDLALAVYAAFPEGAEELPSSSSGTGAVASVNAAGEAEGAALLAALSPKQRAVIGGMDWRTLANMLPDWLEVRHDGAEVWVRRGQTLAQLEEAIHNEESKRE